MNSGVYTITNKIDGKIYVGKAIHVRKRLAEHLSTLKNNCHKNVHLQNAFNKYGKDNFIFEVLEEYHREFLLSMENWWCNMLNTHNRNYGYNIQPTNPYGISCASEETKKKRSAISKARGIPDKVREAAIKANTGAKRSEESRKRMSEAHKGKKQLRESVKKQQESRKNNGQPWHSEETIEKMSKAKLGKKAKPGAHQKAWETRRQNGWKWSEEALIKREETKR
jgi:group I intron endonuclease